MANLENKYGFIIGQQIGDMVITDMYRSKHKHLVYCIKIL